MDDEPGVMNKHSVVATQLRAGGRIEAGDE